MEQFEKGTILFMKKMKSIMNENRQNEYFIHLDRDDIWIKHKENKEEVYYFFETNILDAFTALLWENGFETTIDHFGGFDSDVWDI